MCSQVSIMCSKYTSTSKSHYYISLKILVNFFYLFDSNFRKKSFKYPKRIKRVLPIRAKFDPALHKLKQKNINIQFNKKIKFRSSFPFTFQV